VDPHSSDLCCSKVNCTYFFGLCLKGWITWWCNFFWGEEFSDSNFVSVCSCLWKILGNTDLYTFFNNPKIVHTVSSLFLGHYNGGMVVGIQKSSSELWHSTVWLVKIHCFPASSFAQLKTSANPSGGANSLVSDSLLCSSILIIMLASSNPCCLGSLNSNFLSL